MTDETDANVGGTEGDPSPVEDAPEATAEQPTGADEAGQADDAGEETELAPKRVPWFQKRIDEVTRQKYDEQRRADYLQGQLDALARGQQPAQQQQVGPPDRWEDPDGYDRWLVQTAVDVARQQTAEELRQQQAARSYEDRVAVVRAAKPDFDTVVQDPSLPISPLMADMIRESASGPEIAYHLGTNRQEAERIARLPSHRQAAELGRIEASLTRAPPSPKPIPPAPPQTVGGVSSGLVKSMEQMSYSEFKKMRDAEELNRNR